MFIQVDKDPDGVLSKGTGCAETGKILLGLGFKVVLEKTVNEAPKVRM